MKQLVAPAEQVEVLLVRAGGREVGTPLHGVDLDIEARLVQLPLDDLSDPRVVAQVRHPQRDRPRLAAGRLRPQLLGGVRIVGGARMFDAPT